MARTWNRRQLMQYSAGSGAAWGWDALTRPSTAHAATGATSAPHVVMIVTDEERHWSTIESLMPSDKLATYRRLISGRMALRNQGVRFQNYFTPVAPCSPSRGVLYTGHHAVDNGVVDNMDFDTQASMRAEVPTVADVLARAGYYCAYKGKVHLARDEDLTDAQDMETRFGFLDWQGPSRMGDSEGPLSGTLFDDDVAGYAQTWLQSKGLELHRAGQPFFLAVNFINPHDIMMVDVDGRQGSFQLPQGPNPTSSNYDPNTTNSFPLSSIPSRAPYFYWWDPIKPANANGSQGYSVNNCGPRPGVLDEWASMLSGGFGNITLDDRVTTKITVYRNNSQPGQGTQTIDAPLWKVYLNYYLNCIIDNDRAVNTVVNTLKNSVLADRTLVIFTADHGELALSHMGYSRFYQAATTKSYESLSVTAQQRPVVMPLRQKGPFVYQENNQLPLVVARLSDKTGSLAKKLLPTVNVDTPALASSVDLLPTLVHWAQKSFTWYTEQFGTTLSQLGMLNKLPGVSLHKLLSAPNSYPQAKWSDGSNGRQWVLFTSDTLASSLDADYAYLAIWGQCSGQSMNLNKRGCMRGLFDGTHKYARYFSPHDYALNGAAFAGLSYTRLVAQGQNGQDIQLFRHDTAAGRQETYNSAADSGAPVATLNRSLYNAMLKELKHVTQAPDTVQHVLDGDVVDACA